MGRRKTASQVDSHDSREVLEDVVASLLDLLGTDQVQRDLIHSLRRLADALDLQEQLQDDWFLSVEHCATLVREHCQQFLDTTRSLSEKVHGLVRKLESASRVSAVSRATDSVRTVLACRSFAASYRLQIQCDEQIVEEIVSFLSHLYVHNSVLEMNETNANGTCSRVPSGKLRQLIECLVAHQVLLQDTQWIKVLQNLPITSDRAEPKSLQIASKKAAKVGDEHHNGKLLLDASDLQQARNSFLLEKEDVMGAVEFFLGGAHDLHLQSTFILLVGPRGSGKSFLCDEIERRTRATADSAVHGKIKSLYVAHPRVLSHLYCCPHFAKILQFYDRRYPLILWALRWENLKMQ